MLRKVYQERSASTLFMPDAPLPELLFINHIANEPDWIVGSISNRDWCEILLATAGKAYYTIERKMYTITAGDMIVFNQGMIHEACSDQNEPIDRFVCALRNVHLVGRPENHILYDNSSPVIPLGKQTDEMKNLFMLLMTACSEPGCHAYHVAQHTLCAILSLLDEHLGRLQPHAGDSGNDSLAHEILAYIDSHYAESLTLRSLADQFFISTDYLSHIIRAETGYTPINHMLNRRIGEAQRLLLSTMLPISHIGEIVGFANINHFSSAFKKRIGISPSRFRQNYNITSIPRNAMQVDDIDSIHIL